MRNLKCETLDLLQLHCPPTEVYYRPEVFGCLDDLIAAGKIRFYGVSVEKVEEGLKAIEYPNVQSVQIDLYLFRQRPADLFLAQAKKKGVGVLARVPLASGLLTGKVTAAREFPKDDHRNFNRQGEALIEAKPSPVSNWMRDGAQRRHFRHWFRLEDPDPAGPQVDPDVRRGHLCDSGCQAGKPGRGECRGGQTCRLSPPRPWTAWPGSTTCRSGPSSTSIW